MSCDNLIAEKILFLLRDEAMHQFPAFPEAFGQLRFQPRTGLLAPLGTDGLCLFYDPSQIPDCFRQDPGSLRESFLHLHLHCLSGHLVQGYDQKAELWDEACDLAAAMLLAKLKPQGMSPELSRRLHEEWSAAIAEVSADPGLIFDARIWARAIKKSPALRKLARDCCRDTHKFWLRISPESPNDTARASGDSAASQQMTAQQLAHLEQVHRQWQFPAAKIKKEISKHSGKHGSSSGKGAEAARLTQKDSIDYHQFLRRFTVSREEAVLDMDSFDYIPYYFGLTNYKNMPFIEPLEYQEVNRLDELAIAIDTSGSCSGRIVRRFLEETWNILRQRENFFSRMRLHLIQCDSMIQEHRIFTSAEEWEAALPDFQIRGFGDTDFRPVFELLDRLIAQKEIRRLRGLLYFTDGDGIFPRSRPSYETAFVFLNHELEKHEIPGWGIRLNLNLPDDF